MELMEAIRTRRSVRVYEGRAVPEAHLRRIIEAATWAPSGFNKQPWKFIVIRERPIIEQMVAAVQDCNANGVDISLGKGGVLTYKEQ